MIRYICDCCKRELDPNTDIRYVVKIEVAAALDPQDLQPEETDRDYLEEIQQYLEHLHQMDCPEVSEDVYREFRFDLCSECYRRFIQNPLGRESAKAMQFSKN